MIEKAYFALAFHLHQPIGNIESVIERAYLNCYKPLIETLCEYPDIKFSIHISGCLLDYFEENHPEMLETLGCMCGCGQVEFLSGGYYEPILIAIPERDLFGQIEMMSGYLKSRFGYKAKGMWIPERVWAPYLAKMISEAGIKYCILDDTHILRAGVKKEDTYGYFLTNGNLAVFPSDKKLRYTIPFGKPSDVTNYFKSVAERLKAPLFTYGDDGEKFGEWPGTHKWVYEERYLKNLLEELRRNSSWLKIVHLSHYLGAHRPLREIEIPEASYDEMIEWTGGSWLNFLKKYPETDQMHKKMHYVSNKLDKAVHSRKVSPELKRARLELYKGECNCGYWHGVFGGLYLYHLRSAIYNHLIEADKTIDSVMHKKDKRWLKIEKFDFDNDGKDEVVMENASFGLYIDPQDGGTLKELDYRPQSVNIINTLSRRSEPYHKKILEMIKESRKTEGGAVRTIHDDIKTLNTSLSQEITYDRYERACFRDYLLDSKIKRESFMKNNFMEIDNFSGSRYEARIEKDKVILDRRGKDLSISKSFIIKPEKGLEVNYILEKKGRAGFNRLLGVELNLTMPYLNSDRYSYYSGDKRLASLNEQGAAVNPASFTIRDSERGLGIKFSLSKAAKAIWYFPVKTVSQSERAYELNFQSSCLLFIWKPVFEKERAFSLNIGISFTL